MSGGGVGTVSRHDSAQIVNRTRLAVTEEEYLAAKQRQEAALLELNALSEAKANVEAYDEARARQMAAREAQLRAYEDQQAAMVAAEEQQRRDARRAQVTALSQSVEPLYLELRDRESAYKDDAEEVKLRRGVK